MHVAWRVSLVVSGARVSERQLHQLRQKQGVWSSLVGYVACLHRHEPSDAKIYQLAVRSDQFLLALNGIFLLFHAIFIVNGFTSQLFVLVSLSNIYTSCRKK